MRFFDKVVANRMFVAFLCLLLFSAELYPSDAKEARKKLTLIGIDAADMHHVEFLRRKGLLPNFGRLIDEGASGYLESIYPMFSPIIWTTIATGMSPIEHGIRGFNLYQPDTEQKIPTNAVVRQSKAIWEILSQNDFKSLITAWFNSWPADKINGIMISDYVFPLSKMDQTEKFLRDKLNIPFKFQTYPETVLPKIERFLIDRNAENAEFERRFGVKVEDAPFALRHSFAKDGSYFKIFRALRRQYRFDFQTLYFQGTDLLGHDFMREFSLWQKGKLKPGTAEYRRGYYTAAYYKYLDEMIGIYLDHIREPNETLLVISDHGFEDKGSPVLSKVSDVNFSKRRYWHGKHGLIMAYGENIKPGTIKGATVFDIAPTILAYYGLPVAKDMRGRPIKNISSERRKRIDSYDSSKKGFDQRAYARFIFNKVSSLGYSQSRN